jgi:Leucine-rich repeat (LRR) protein
MWVNSGLISQDGLGTQSLVDVGEKYLVQLTRKSFFDIRFDVDSVGREDRESGYYVMHDLMHDLATNVSFGECLRMVHVGSPENVPSTVRHVRVEYIDNFPMEKMKKISSLENLRTIIVKNSTNNVEGNILNTVEEVVESSKSLRLFETELWHGSHFASKLTELKHLRCIILRNTRTTQESMSGVSKLYHLKKLIWRATKIGSKQVRDVGYLDRLQYMSYEPYACRCSMVPVARLTSLQVLENYPIRRVKGYDMSALKDLRSLRTLSVNTLDNVDNQEEAQEAKMKEKKCLVSLRLEWTECDGVRMTDELVLDSLEPHANLKKLCISHFSGSRIPYWIAESHVENLVNLDFNFCEHIEELPSLGKLLKLKDLRLCGLTRLRRIGQPLLHASVDGFMELSLPPSLQKLQVDRCLKLEELPLLPPSLMRLDIREVGLIRLPRVVKLHTSSGETISSKWLDIMVISCQCLTSLEGSLFEQKQCIQVIREMSIIDCMHLESAPLPFEKMNGLGEICIIKCPELRLLRGAEDKLWLSSLRRLIMGQCGDLELLLLQSLQGFTNLSNLSLDNCSVVESLPTADVFEHLTSLRTIRLDGCGNLSSLGGLRSLPRLEYLEIRKCSKLTEISKSLTFGVSGCEEEPRSFTQIETIYIDHSSLLLVEPVKSLCRTRRLTILDGSEMLDVIEPWLLRNCASLQYLDIFKVNLESLPVNISELSSLESLRLYGSDQLRSLPNLPSSLQRLYIGKCHPELREKATERGSLEWNKISHIPHVEIGRPTLVIQLHAYGLLLFTKCDPPFSPFFSWHG